MVSDMVYLSSGQTGMEHLFEGICTLDLAHEGVFGRGFAVHDHVHVLLQPDFWTWCSAGWVCIPLRWMACDGWLDLYLSHATWKSGRTGPTVSDSLQDFSCNGCWWQVLYLLARLQWSAQHLSSLRHDCWGLNVSIWSDGQVSSCSACSCKRSDSWLLGQSVTGCGVDWRWNWWWRGRVLEA